MNIPKVCKDSQNRARQKLICEALGLKVDRNGEASMGDIRIDADRMFLAEIEASGTVRGIRGLQQYLGRLWEDLPTSERHLNRFLIRLGSAVANKKKRRALPDWLQGVNQTERFIVEGWTGNIVVDNEVWPPLCCFSTNALATFLTLVKRPLWRLQKGTRLPVNPRNLERALQRLGLVRIRKGRTRHVEKKSGVFNFR